MDSCCEGKSDELAELRARQGRVLYIVLVINAIMFLVEFISGWLANSTALLGDSLDMFGDATVYALTLYALHRSPRTRAGAALVKGGFMLLFGLVVIGEAVRKSVLGVTPEAQWMGAVGLLALAANAVCFILLYTHRSDDLNMRSTWLCSRNDIIANSSVIAAAVLVALTGTLWPDVAVGLAIAVLFLHSAWQVLAEALAEWRAHGPRVARETRHVAQPRMDESLDACVGSAVESTAAGCRGTRTERSGDAGQAAEEHRHIRRRAQKGHCAASDQSGKPQRRRRLTSLPPGVTPLYRGPADRCRLAAHGEEIGPAGVAVESIVGWAE